MRCVSLRSRLTQDCRTARCVSLACAYREKSDAFRCVILCFPPTHDWRTGTLNDASEAPR